MKPSNSLIQLLFLYSLLIFHCLFCLFYLRPQFSCPCHFPQLPLWNWVDHCNGVLSNHPSYNGVNTVAVVCVPGTKLKTGCGSFTNCSLGGIGNCVSFIFTTWYTKLLSFFDRKRSLLCFATILPAAKVKTQLRGLLPRLRALSRLLHSFLLCIPE